MRFCRSSWRGFWGVLSHPGRRRRWRFLTSSAYGFSAIPSGAVAVSPADGKVVLVRHRPERTEVCIFMNVFDVHVNRTPIGGKVVDVPYSPRKFMMASRDEASCANERNTLTVEARDGVRVTFSQIAGLIARRIVCRVKAGDYVT